MIFCTLQIREQYFFCALKCCKFAATKLFLPARARRTTILSIDHFKFRRRWRTVSSNGLSRNVNKKLNRGIILEWSRTKLLYSKACALNHDVSRYPWRKYFGGHSVHISMSRIQWWASYVHKVTELLYFRYCWKKLATFNPLPIFPSNCSVTNTSYWYF